MIAYRQPPSYAGIPLAIVSFSAQLGRDLAEHRPSRGRGAQLSDRGLAPRRDDLAIALTGTAEEIADKRAQLLTLRQSGLPRTFVHPLDGSWPARLHDLSETLSDGEASLRMTLVEDVPFAKRTRDPRETVTAKDVDSAAAALDLAITLAPVDLPDDAPTGAEAASMIAAWPEASAATQEAQLGSFRARAQASKEVLAQSSDPRSVEALRRLQTLRGTIEMYQIGLQYVVHHTVTVTTAMPLARYLTQLYGGAEALAVMDEVTRLNTIANPLRLRLGAVLRLPRV